MIDNLSFDHLNKTQAFIQDIDTLPPDQLGFSFISHVKETLPLDIASIFISNFEFRKSVKVLYVLRINREKAELVELSEHIENSIIYDFLSQDIYLNSKKMSNFYKKAFKQRLSHIIKDLQNNKSNIFEEVI
ncbi:hypothetical protein DID78_02595 [Candidatus Marinamargulisbacteria bacterium SCGC AG-343-D04]|nr:hypothetical protein DID78_02595 [Candidatus Marinamargulisbacteria bacterium SCGC AG-343-D04]